MDAGYEPSARRTRLVATHVLHAMVGALILVAVVLALVSGEHAWQAALVGCALAGAYIASRWHPWVLILVLGLWVASCLIAPGFVWVAFALYFVVLGDLPTPWSLVAVAAIALWSILVSGSPVGPIIGAAVAIAMAGVVALQQRDAEAYHELVEELRKTEGELARGEHQRGVLAERERLAREIHDTVAQGLSSVVVLARTGAESDDPKQALRLIEATARENLAEARRFVHDLGSADAVPLDESLQVAVADANRQAAAVGLGLHVDWRSEGEARELDPDTVLALHRATAASIANVLQHAQARRCQVGLSWFDDRVVIDIVDDGVGFDPAAVGARSFGIRAARARLAEVGGTLHIDSTPGEGTTVALSVPYVPGEGVA